MRKDPITAFTVIENMKAAAEAYGGGRSLNRILEDARINRSYFSNVKKPDHGLRITYLDRIATEMGAPLAAFFEGLDRNRARRELNRIADTLLQSDLNLLVSIAGTMPSHKDSSPPPAAPEADKP